MARRGTAGQPRWNDYSTSAGVGIIVPNHGCRAAVRAAIEDVVARQARAMQGGHHVETRVHQAPVVAGQRCRHGARRRRRLLRAVDAQSRLRASESRSSSGSPATRAASTATRARTICAASRWRSRSSTPRAACSAARSSAIHTPTPRPTRRPARASPSGYHPRRRSFLIGALHSGVANAISQVAQQVRHDLPQHQLELGADRGRQELPPRQVRLGRQRHELRARPIVQERRSRTSARTGCC